MKKTPGAQKYLRDPPSERDDALKFGSSIHTFHYWCVLGWP